MSIELFFDTETTGLCFWNLPSDDPCQPDVIQLGALLCEDGKEIDFIDTLVKPPWDWLMSVETEAIHGITRERIQAEGLFTTEVVGKFLDLEAQAELLVCHNTQFDAKLMRTALHRCGYTEQLEQFVNRQYYCTMKQSTKFCNIPGKRGPKWPKLVELHERLFGESFAGAHSAIVDVRATARCYYEMKRRGL